MNERGKILNYFEVEMGDKIPRPVAQVMFDAAAMHVLIARRMLLITQDAPPARKYLIQELVRCHGEALAYCVDSLKDLAGIPEATMLSGFMLLFAELEKMDKRVEDTAATLLKEVLGRKR
jgi:hypothetical protein